MSLDRSQRIQTSKEFQENFQRAGLDEQHFLDDLRMRPDELHAILRMDDGVDPARVWLLRDYLTNAIRARGQEPYEWATMTEAKRAAADGWFGLSEAPTPSL